MEMDICDWLREYLRCGPKEVSEIRDAARRAGYSKSELRKAKQFCRINVTNNWNAALNRTDKWFWSLPESG